jgi:hypothetical protein
MEVQYVGCTNSQCPKPQNAEKICVVDLRGSLTIVFCLEWTWVHGCVPRAREYRRQARVAGPNDVTKGDVDPPKRATCHCGERQQLCYGPENKVIHDFRIRKGGARRLNTPTHEVASWRRSAST